MNDGDQGRTTGLSSAVAKNKQRQSPSGCMCIFRQLFDWNMSSKNKKKLNLISSGSDSVTLQSSSKRFRAQATKPNCYPAVTRLYGACSGVDVLGSVHHKLQMKAPTLVAKLMGLDSIPATVVETQKQLTLKPKPSPSQQSVFKPRLQKNMMQFDTQGRMAMCRQADSLQLKNVLSKHHHSHHTKHPRPVRVCPGRNNNNAVRMIDAEHPKEKRHDVDKVPSRLKLGSLQTLRITSAANNINDISSTNKRVENARFDKEIIDTSFFMSLTTPERKRRTTMIHGNENVKNNASALGKLKVQGSSEACMEPMFSTDEASTLGLIDSISVILDKLGYHGIAYEKKLIHFKEIILHVGMLLESEVVYKSAGGNEFFICQFFNQLEIIADAMWSGSIALPGFWKFRSRNQLLWILFDLGVEYLDSSFGNNSDLELDLLIGLPRVTVQQLILGLNSEIAKWAYLRGKKANKLVEWEVRQSSGILSDYEMEAHKVCSELDEYLLKELVEEIVLEVYGVISQCHWHSFF